MTAVAQRVIDFDMDNDSEPLPVLVPAQPATALTSLEEAAHSSTAGAAAGAGPYALDALGIDVANPAGRIDRVEEHSRGSRA